MIHMKKHRRQWRSVTIALLCLFTAGCCTRAIPGFQDKVAAPCAKVQGGAAVQPGGAWSGTSRKHRRQWRSVTMALLCSFTAGCCTCAILGFQEKVAAPCTKVKGGAAVKPGSAWLGTSQKHRRQWRFVTMAQVLDFKIQW